MRGITRHQREFDIYECGFDKVNNEKLRLELGLPSLSHFLASKRLNFAAGIWEKDDSKTVKARMMEEIGENGEWYKMLQQDMEKYDITSLDDLVQKNLAKQLKQHIEKNNPDHKEASGQ